MKIIKEPEYTEDSYYFILEKHDELRQDNVAYLRSGLDLLLKQKSDLYLQKKRELFRTFEITLGAMSDFYDRPSMYMCSSQHNLVGTIYTASACLKNNMHYEQMMFAVRENKNHSRRCVIRLADPLSSYMDSSVNTSCLNIIHYYKDTVKLFFRASDMKYELFYDLKLIKEFFIDPVFSNTQVEIHVISSTAQNIINPTIFLK